MFSYLLNARLFNEFLDQNLMVCDVLMKCGKWDITDRNVEKVCPVSEVIGVF